MLLIYRHGNLGVGSDPGLRNVARHPISAECDDNWNPRGSPRRVSLHPEINPEKGYE
jgi:hypothetical protein